MATVVVKLGSSIVADDAGEVRTRRARTRSATRSPRATPPATTWWSSPRARSRAACALMGLPMRPTAMEELQAASAVGQGKLYRPYDELLQERGVPSRPGAAHVLRHVGAHPLPERAPHAPDAARAGACVPVINENDTTTTDEISFGDNDFLAAQVAILIGADRLVLLTDTDGLYTRGPAHRPGRAAAWRRCADVEELEALRHRRVDLAARLGRDALEGGGRRDGHRRRHPRDDRERGGARGRRGGAGRRAERARASIRRRGGCRASSCG